MYTRQLNDRIEDKQILLVFFIRWNEGEKKKKKMYVHAINE